MPTLTIILDTQISPATPTYTDWFPLNTLFLVFQSDSTGEYTETGEFIEVAVALFSKIQEAPLIERLCTPFQGAINTIDLITVPNRYRADLFQMRLLINPSSGFHCRIIAISDNSNSITDVDFKLNEIDFQSIIDKLDNSPNIQLP